MKTKRLDIRLVTLNDVEDMFEYCSNPHTMRYERSEFTDIASLRKMIQWFVDNKGMYVVRELNKNKVIGQITLTIMNPTFNNEYNLGYIFHEDYQGKGYCTEACNAVIKYGFDQLNIHRIRAACNPDNIGSWKVMEKLGMCKQAHFKKSVAIRNDDEGNPIYTDEYVYAINVEDLI